MRRLKKKEKFGEQLDGWRKVWRIMRSLENNKKIEA